MSEKKLPALWAMLVKDEHGLYFPKRNYCSEKLEELDHRFMGTTFHEAQEPIVAGYIPAPAVREICNVFKAWSEDALDNMEGASSHEFEEAEAHHVAIEECRAMLEQLIAEYEGEK